MNDIEYFEEALSLYDTLPSYHTDYLTLAGRTIHLNTPSPALRYLFLPAIAHLISKEKVDNPDLTIWYGEDKDLFKRLAAPQGEPFNNLGYRAGDEQTDVKLFFQPWQPQISLYSSAKRTGIFWVSAIEDVKWWESTYPFRTIFHLWTRDLPSQLVHAGAIAIGQTGVLITGASGSGKSTSCLNLLRTGKKYLGDDYVWIELEPAPVVHTLYQTAKIEPGNFDTRFNDWRPFLKNPETYLNQKAILDVKEMLPSQFLPSVKIKAILLPTVSGLEQTTFRRVSSTNAFFGMAPSTLLYSPHNRDISYQKLLRISSALPTYSWQLGFDIDKFQSSFNNFAAHELS